MPLPEGLLLVDKPEGPTSHDVVAAVRRITGQRRIGHAGTLDPMATGLLPLVLGRASRLVRFLPGSPKIYEGAFLLGLSTSSDDVTGEVLRRQEDRLPGPDDVMKAAARLRGKISQIPPAVSARKVGGRRLYRLARRGEKVEAPPREVEVFRFDLTPTGEPVSWSFRAAVSPGTYIRSLVRDLGDALGCGGTLSSLRRTAVGPMSVDGAPTLDALQDDPGPVLERALVPLESVHLDLPDHALADPVDAQRFLSGAPVWLHGEAAQDAAVRVLGPDGTLLGIGDRSSDRLQPRVVLGVKS